MVLASFATPLTVPSTVPVTVLQLVINKNIQEAADHGVIYLEEKIRLGHNKEISEGIILPGQAGSYFMYISNAIRNLFIDYKRFP